MNKHTKQNIKEFFNRVGWWAFYHEVLVTSVIVSAVITSVLVYVIFIH